MITKSTGHDFFNHSMIITQSSRNTGLSTKRVIPGIHIIVVYSAPCYLCRAINIILVNNTSSNIIAEILARVPYIPWRDMFDTHSHVS